MTAPEPPAPASRDRRAAQLAEACRSVLAASSADAGLSALVEIGVRWAMQLGGAEGAGFARRQGEDLEWMAAFGAVQTWRGRRCPGRGGSAFAVPARGSRRVDGATMAADMGVTDGSLSGYDGVVVAVGVDASVLGALCLVWGQEQPPDLDDLLALELLAGCLGVALERAQQLQRLSRLSRVFDASRPDLVRAHSADDLMALRRQMGFLKRSLANRRASPASVGLDGALDDVLAQATRMAQAFEAALPAAPPPAPVRVEAPALAPPAAEPQLDRGALLGLLARRAPIEQSLHAIVAAVEAAIPGALAAVWRVRQGLFRYAAGRSLPRGYVQAVDGADLQRELGVPYQALGATELVIEPDLRATGPRDPGADHGLRACWALAIGRSAALQDGVLTVHFRKTRQPTEAERLVIAEAALVAAIALGQWADERRIQHQAEHDPVTGLPNRPQLEARLEQAMTTARGMRQPLAVALVDLDNFKVVNDSLGHTAGDALLEEVGRRLAGCVRSSDLVARLGGDEFALVLPLATERDAGQVAQKVLRALSAGVTIAGQDVYVSSSIGLALFPADGDSAEGLLRAADAAMYGAKRQGRNRYQFFTPAMRTAAEDWLSLVSDLHRAVPEGQLVLHYQPKVNLETGAVTGAEALIRWQHPRLGLLYPNRFLDLAEQTGLIMDIGRWVIEEACRQARHWHDVGLGHLRVSVNLSAHQFRDDDLTAVVARALEVTGLPPEALELEITENMLMHDIDEVLEHMTSLKRLGGVKLSIDDFGTGYSSLNYLKRFPVDALKIDRSFLLDIAGDAAAPAQDVAIIKTIVTLGQSLGLTLVAEGVETATHLELLRGMRCDEVQGYLVSRPVPAPQFVAFVQSGAAAALVAPN